MKISLKLLKETDINKIYLQWFLDADVVRFSEITEYKSLESKASKGSERNVILNIEIRIPLIGKMVENLIVREFSKATERDYQIIRRYLESIA